MANKIPGFTLLEALIVLVITGLLISLVYFAINGISRFTNRLSKQLDQSTTQLSFQRAALRIWDESDSLFLRNNTLHCWRQGEQIKIEINDSITVHLKEKSIVYHLQSMQVRLLHTINLHHVDSLAEEFELYQIYKGREVNSIRYFKRYPKTWL